MWTFSFCCTLSQSKRAAHGWSHVQRRAHWLLNQSRAGTGPGWNRYQTVTIWPNHCYLLHRNAKVQKQLPPRDPHHDALQILPKRSFYAIQVWEWHSASRSSQTWISTSISTRERCDFAQLESIASNRLALRNITDDKRYQKRLQSATATHEAQSRDSATMVSSLPHYLVGNVHIWFPRLLRTRCTGRCEKYAADAPLWLYREQSLETPAEPWLTWTIHSVIRVAEYIDADHWSLLWLEVHVPHG